MRRPVDFVELLQIGGLLGTFGDRCVDFDGEVASNEVAFIQDGEESAVVGESRVGFLLVCHSHRSSRHYFSLALMASCVSIPREVCNGWVIEDRKRHAATVMGWLDRAGAVVSLMSPY